MALPASAHTFALIAPPVGIHTFLLVKISNFFPYDTLSRIFILHVHFDFFLFPVFPVNRAEKVGYWKTGKEGGLLDRCLTLEPTRDKRSGEGRRRGRKKGKQKLSVFIHNVAIMRDRGFAA